MKKIILFILVAFVANVLHAQDFITVWNLNNPGSSTNSINFGVGTTGTVNYTWETIPAGTTGSGSFSGATAIIAGLPTNAIIRLKIDTTNFNRININNNADKSRLVDIEQWGGVAWSSMETAYYGCDSLNLSATDIPNLSLVTNMGSMFNGCISLNSPANIDAWNTSNVTIMSGMFYGAINFNQPIGNWNTSNVTTMSQMFDHATSFNQPIGNWNTGNVTNMYGMFAETIYFGQSKDFNQPIGNWNTSNVTNMKLMFFRASDFNQPIGNWNTSNVTNMSGMFNAASNFNQPIGNWNTGNVTDMSSIFAIAPNFNQPIGNWNTSSVTNMQFMFCRASDFNQPIGNWNTSNVTNISGMFNEALSFNQPTGNWNTSNVTNMSGIFAKAPNFNQPIGNWNTTNVTNMSYMFYDATSFNQPLGNWNLTTLINNQNMLDNCGMDCTNYSTTLDGWANNINTPNLLTLGASGINYGTNAVSSRNYLLNTKGWTINGDIANGLVCCVATSSTITQTSSNSYTFNNQILTQSGIYYDTLINSTGCDSIITLNLTILNAQDFITVWNLNNPGPSTNSIEFGVGTTGTVNYTWETIPAGTTGNGSFSGATATIAGLPTNAIIRLKIDTTNFNRININNNADKSRLVDIEQWGGVAWSSMETAYYGCDSLNISATDIPNLSLVSSMEYMFRLCSSLNSLANIDTWNTSNVTTMGGMFYSTSFNQPIGNWNTSNVTNMWGMFAYASNFNQPIGNWNTSNVTVMGGMFGGATSFNQPIGNWNTTNVISMGGMFDHATSFNQPIGNWNTTNVNDMEYMFYYAQSFNQPIGNWNTSIVNTMEGMFYDATSFNQPIGNWNTSNVTRMDYMFAGATSFNQPIGNWNTSNVTRMDQMFQFATNFNQPIGNWNLTALINNQNMLSNCGMDCTNYSSTLNGWANNINTPNGLNLGASGINYGTNAVSGRNYLLNTKGWTINGDIANGFTCCVATSNTINQTSSNSYTFNNQILTQSGIYYDTLINSTGCDSIITLNLTILNAQDFITVWNLNNPGSSTNSIEFGVGTTGTVNYTWETIPAGTTGNGSFSGATATIAGLPTNAIIRLKIDTTHFNRININNNADKSRLVDIEQWGGVVWTSMESAYYGCDSLNISATDIPNLSFVSSMESMFRICWSLNSPANMDTWNTSNVTNMSWMFAFAPNFNQPIGNWNTGNVTDMQNMFLCAYNFNQPIDNWNTSNVTDMSEMFASTNFNQPIGNWNTGNVTDMQQMFYFATSFNQPIGNWNTSNVTNMFYMFWGASSFNQPIGNWNTGNVTDMSGVFAFAPNFNQPIGNWNTGNVTDMQNMFSGASNFNQPIDNWNTSNVVYMVNMFLGASNFNQPIGNWNTGNVIIMESMFQNATSFNQPLGNWNLTAAIYNQYMLDSCGMDCTNYSSTLNGWANNINTPNGLNLGASGIQYGTNAVSSRNYLLNTKGWTITGDIANGLVCCIATTSNQSQTACNTYLFNNQTITQSGIYYDTLINSAGCDSIISLNLTINNANTATTQAGTQLSATATGASYQWLTCNPFTIISGATNQTYTATANGDYAVAVTENGCTDTSNCMTVNSVGIHELNAQNLITISPNPTHSIFKIECPMNGANVILYNSFGQKLLTSKIENQTSLINISQYPKGIYIAEINDDKTSYRVKIIKE